MRDLVEIEVRHVTKTAGTFLEFVTTAWVLTKVANFLASPQSNRELFLAILEDLSNDPRVEIVSPTQDWFERGIELFRERLDKDWSLTDCVSIVAMQQYGLTEALTSDHHFEQAGFTILLK